MKKDKKTNKKETSENDSNEDSEDEKKEEKSKKDKKLKSETKKEKSHKDKKDKKGKEEEEENEDLEEDSEDSKKDKKSKSKKKPKKEKDEESNKDDSSENEKTKKSQSKKKKNISSEKQSSEEENEEEKEEKKDKESIKKSKKKDTKKDEEESSNEESESKSKKKKDKKEEKKKKKEEETKTKKDKKEKKEDNEESDDDEETKEKEDTQSKKDKKGKKEKKDKKDKKEDNEEEKEDDEETKQKEDKHSKKNKKDKKDKKDKKEDNEEEEKDDGETKEKEEKDKKEHESESEGKKDEIEQKGETDEKINKDNTAELDAETKKKENEKEEETKDQEDSTEQLPKKNLDNNEDYGQESNQNKENKQKINDETSKEEKKEEKDSKANKTKDDSASNEEKDSEKQKKEKSKKSKAKKEKEDKEGDTEEKKDKKEKHKKSKVKKDKEDEKEEENEEKEEQKEKLKKSKVKKNKKDKNDSEEEIEKSEKKESKKDKSKKSQKKNKKDKEDEEEEEEEDKEKETKKDKNSKTKKIEKHKKNKYEEEDKEDSEDDDENKKAKPNKNKEIKRTKKDTNSENGSDNEEKKQKLKSSKVKKKKHKEEDEENEEEKEEEEENEEEKEEGESSDNNDKKKKNKTNKKDNKKKDNKKMDNKKKEKEKEKKENSESESEKKKKPKASHSKKIKKKKSDEEEEEEEDEDEQNSSEKEESHSKKRSKANNKKNIKKDNKGKSEKRNKSKKGKDESDSENEEEIEEKKSKTTDKKGKNKKDKHKSKKESSDENDKDSDDSDDSDDSSDKKHKDKKQKYKKTKKDKDRKTRKNRFSDKESDNSESSHSSQRSKSSMTNEEKEKKKKKEQKKKQSNASQENEEEIIKDLKNGQDILNKSSSDSNDEDNDDNNNNNGDTGANDNTALTNKEKEEKNVTRHTKIIKELKTSFDKLIPKNQSKKFLLDEKNTNKDSQKSIQEIIDNFLKTDSVIKKYITEFKSDEKKKKFFKKQGFILTEKSMERMALLIHYILNGIPVLFEGNTGTSKTRTTLTACNYIKKFIQKKGDNERELIRYNLSAETKIDDIIAKYVSDQDSFIGLIVQNGPFVDAYVNGKIILFDEINLAPANVLQCIQQSLDNGFLSVETNGRCLLKFDKNPNFALVATQNPNKGAFAGKRQELGPEFLSRFQKIYFPDILKEEMQEIALGIAKNVEYLKSGEPDEKYKKQLLKDIVNLHFDWAKETDSQADIQCFTIREIESVIECLSNHEDPYNVIMTIYGGRFRQNRKDKLKINLQKYDTLAKLRDDNKPLPANFPQCFVNDSLVQTVKSVLLALRNKRNVIIVGNDESGLTQVAEWCSKYFNKEIKKKKIDDSIICFCTKNLECTDLIGTQKISDSSGNDNELIKFEPRFLYDAIIEGNCVVLDCINEAPSRVIERLNGLLDKKNSKKEEKFEVPENTANPEININKDFRIICTSNFEKINQISPAFVNRFEVIVLEDQLKGLSDSKIKKFIELLCNKYQKECHDNYKKRREKMKKSDKNKKKVQSDDPFSKTKNKDNANKTKLKIDKTIEISPDNMDLILDKIRILSSGRNPNESYDDSTSASSVNDKEVDENSKKYLTMSSINKFCRTLVILINKFKSQTQISIESIIDFSFELLFEEHLSNKNEAIQKYLIYELIESSKQVRDLGDEQYYFEKSESLKKFMVQMYACSLVNQYLCIIGPPGIGKTIGARAFSYIREIIFGLTYESPFYMHTFNQFTRASDYYGISSLKDEKLIFRDGTLTKSIRQGNVFIGDEFNISSEDCMKAITPILELKFNEAILIPGIENKISIDPDFFFIICQNTKNTFGRKDLPEKIKVKIKVINYPDRIKEEIESICESICENLFKGRAQKKLTVNEARLCGDFMMALNEKEVLTPWSLRDISKLFARINKQSINPKHYEGLNVQENILFYILSSTNDSLISERLPVVVDLISETFKLSPNESNILKELYTATPYIKNKNMKIYIEKGKISIFYCNYKPEIFDKLYGLPSILNALFKILITSDDEPILISGPSSFKTFLSKLLFQNGKSDVISLNSESTISQLIGSATLLTTEKSKNYYLMQIYEILQANNIDNLLKDLEDFETNKDKIKKNIEELTKAKKINKDYTFYYALEHFKEKLFRDEKNKKSLFDMIIEFKPGIFISARIKGCNLILKNITYVKTENLERLNEALTGNKKITLNEDTQNSFTPENNKEISFSNDFRVVGTCNEGEETSLSDAFLSRFTLIYVDKYLEEEELKVLKDTAGDIKDIEFLNQLLDKYYSKFPDCNRMNLSQKINCFQITKEIDKIRTNNSHHENLNFVSYYLLKGLNEKREEKINEINNIFKINKYYDDKNDNSPIEIVKNLKESFVKSKLNDLIMNINPKIDKKSKKDKENKDEKEENKKKEEEEDERKKKKKDKEKKVKENLVFTHKIKEVIDAIHFSLSSKTPLILEGEYGQGKISAIEYYAKMAQLELVQVPISKSTKVDDLLSKTTFKKNEKGNFSLVNSKTPLCHAIECQDNFPNKLVVLEGINNATPAVLEILNSIYGKKGTNILLPNGSKIVKGNMNLISIFNPSDDFTREKLPGNILNNSLYFIVEDPSKIDITNIITYLFNKAELPKDEKDEFSLNFLKAQKIAREGVGEFPITLHEVRKYISLRKSIPELDKKVFMTFIFNYHFSQKENIYKAQKELKLDSFLFNPIINYNGDKKYLTFKSSKASKKNQLKIPIKNPDNIRTKKLINKFNSMTLTEKLCFLFLMCCVIAKKTPIIQGATASGKSFIIKLLAEVLGQDLSIYQLNSNSGISLFTGQSIMKEEFDNSEKEKLRNVLKLIKIKDKKIKDINSKDFIDFQRKIDKKLKSDKLSEEEKKEYENAKDTLTILKSPLNRFMHQDSELITGIKTGKWIALDGIEMASTQISEKLSPLCGEVPTLNVFESGLEDLNFDSSNINPNFRLFIIYNPQSQNSKKIDQSLFNKCIKFTLPPIDSIPRDATTMLYESIVNNSKDKDIALWSNLCARIARYHMEETKKTKENTDLVAGNVPFTSRNLCFISNDFHRTFENMENITIESWLQSIFDNYYWRSFISYSQKEKKKFMDDTLKIINSVPDQQYKVDQELDFSEEFKDLLEILINIQKYAIRNVEYTEFEYSTFLNYCLKVPINKEKMQSIYNNLYDTMILLDNNHIMNEILKNRFYQIKFIENNYENILNHFDHVSGFEDKLELTDDQLLKNEDIKDYLLRMRFLDELLKTESKRIYEPYLNYELFSTYTSELCKILSELIQYKSKIYFEELVKFLFEYPETFKLIHYYYPYNNSELKEGELKYANYYIYFWYNLYNKKYNFSVRIKNQRYDIVFQDESQNDKVNPYFILNENNSLLLSKDSALKKLQNNEEGKYDYVIYYFDKASKENTENMLKWIRDNYNMQNKISPMKSNDEIDKFQLETENFFTNNSSTLIGRIWSLLLNLSDDYLGFIKYLKNSCCFLEKDTLEILEYLYNNLDINHITDLIKNMYEISFFCESISESMLWKYRALLSDLESDDNEENHNNEKYYEYFKSLDIDADDEVLAIKNEMKSITKLLIYWKEDKVDTYKSKLLTLQNLIISYKNKDLEDAEITKLRNDANALLIHLENKVKNKSVKSLNFLKEEITKFTTSNKPTKELYKILLNKVTIFINLAGKENEKKKLDTLFLPNKDQMKLYETKNYKLHEFIFWFSLVKENLNKLFDPDTSEKESMEITMNLYKDSELDPIMTFISEKKLESSGENHNLSFNEQKKVNQMLRGIFISKIRNNKINLDDLNNIVNLLNSRVNCPDEIPDEEYNFSYIISDKYPKNLKLRMPIFEPMDIFYLFYKYDKGNIYKLGEVFNGINCTFGGIKDIAEEIFRKDDYDNMATLSELMGKLFYQNISGKELNLDEDKDLVAFLEGESKKAEDSKDKNKKELFVRIASTLSFIRTFEEKIYKNQKDNSKNYEFILDDFNNLLNDRNKLINCSNIFKKEKEIKETDKTKKLFSPSFIYYINNNQTFINELFNSLNNSDSSIISDINKKRKIDYLPFWLYILRNISSINCIEYGKKENRSNLSNHIADRIKKKISYCLTNNKPLDLKWLNLVLDNISSEIMDPKIHLFYNFFNSLVINLNITSKNLNKFAQEELENYFYNIIDFVFNEKINELLDEDINNEEGNNILKFTKNPSSYLYEKIKALINDKFIKIMNEANIYELNNNFNTEINELSDTFISKIEDTNKALFNAEFEKLKIAHTKSVDIIFSNLCKSNSNMISSIDKILTKNDFLEHTNKQISEEQINDLTNLNTELLQYKKYGIKEKKEDQLIYYSLPYDFTKIKDKKYDLFYMNKYVDIDHDAIKGVIYIINDKNDNEFRERFKYKIFEEDEDDEGEYIPDEVVDIDEKIEVKPEEVVGEGDKEVKMPLLNEDEEEDNEEAKKEEEAKKKEEEAKKKEEEAKKKEEEAKKKNKKKEKINYKIEDFIDFTKAKKSSFVKYEIENEDEIKNAIENGMNIPTKRDVKNPPVILLSKYTVKEFSKYIGDLKEYSSSLLEILKEIKEKRINNKEIITNFETKIRVLLSSLKNVKDMLKLNKNDFEDLNNSSRDIDKEISDFISNLDNYYENYKKSAKAILSEFFNIEEQNIFSLDFSLPSIPKKVSNSSIHLDKMKKDSENLCVPIINIDSEGKNLICCYKSLELNLGKTCPAFYHKPYIINIISFVKEDMYVKIKSYKESKIEQKENKKEDKKEKEEKKDDEEGENDKEKEEGKEEDKDIPKEEKPIAVLEEEILNRYLSVKEYVKKGENIQLFVEIPQTFEEDTMQISSVLNIESISGKKLDLNVNIILTTIPISVLISCKEYKLIKEKINYDNNITFEQCFKLDSNEFLGDEEINFELLNYKDNEPIEFFISAKSLDNNSSNMPLFPRIKQKNKFKMTIPKYDFDSNDGDIPRLHCMMEIFINKNFVVYIIIDSLIRPNLTIFKMYDYYSKTFIENEMKIYLNETAQDILKKDKRMIELKCVLFSTYENEDFKVIPNRFNGGIIQEYSGKIKNGKSEFSLYLEFDNSEYKIISSGDYCILNISLNIKKLSFKIKFSRPESTVFSDNYYNHFKIIGKNDISENWRPLDDVDENIKFYVTPFNFSQSEIDYKLISSPINDLNFYYVNKNGIISSETKYEKKYTVKHNYFSSNEYKYCFSLLYKDIWFPLIKNNGSILYKIIYFEDSNSIKKQVYENFYKWENKIKNVYFAYDEISRLKEYKWFVKSDYFYQQAAEIFNKNLIKGLNKFKKEVKYYKKYIEGEEITFEGLAYHIIYNTNNFFHELNKSFPSYIQKQLEYDFNHYRESSKDEQKDLALYNYILRLQDIFDNKIKEFNRQYKKIRIILPDSSEQQKKLLISYYSIDSNIIENNPKIISNYEKQFNTFNRKNNNEIISSEKYLIIGNNSNPVDKDEKQNLENTEDKLNLKLDNSITMILPEVDLANYQDNLSLNKILELYNALIIGSRILPAYLQTAIVNESADNLKESSKYFEILYSIYKNIKENNSSLVHLTINEFISSFSDMIMKLKNAGISFRSNSLLNNIKLENNSKNSFITPPVKIEPMRQKDDWENKKIMEQKIANDFKNDLKNKIEYNNIRVEEIRRIDTTTINNTIIKDDSLNSSNNNININGQKKEEEEEEDLKEDLLNLMDEMEKDINTDLIDEEDTKKVENKKIAFSTSDKGKEKPLSKISRENFENIEKKFNEDYALKYIVDKMKNKVNKNDLTFKYELLKNEIKGYLPNKSNLFHALDSEIKKDEKLPISQLIENSRFLSSKIYAMVAQINYDDINDEILFNKLEANIIIDLARTISNENRYFNMLMICGLASALHFLKIPYTLSAIGDSDFKVRIKSLDEPHSELVLQKLYDISFIKRNVTQLPACLKYFMDNYPAQDESMNRVYYVFTNGFDDELKKCKAWQTKIFNDNKNSFSFIFTKSQVLDKPINSDNKKYLEEIWNEFEQEAQKAYSYITITKTSFKEIGKLDTLAENLSKALLREKELSNKDNSPKVNSLFSIDKSSVLTPDYINLFRSLLSDQLNKPEFNELYIKKNKMPFIYDTQKDNQKQFKIFCQRTGKMIRYDKLDIETQKNILRLAREFKEKRERIKLNPMNIIFKPNLPTQAILCEEGTHLDITELIKYSINKVPNPRLYREVRDGFVKNYGVSIVIDTSISCLNELCLIHTIQTLRILLSALSYDNIPCLDIIIARVKEPVILCSEKSANEILSEKSSFWGVLFSCLEGEPSCDLASAIKAAYNLNRARRTDYTNYIFVLTDGMYSPSQREKIIGVANSCYAKNINLFGIGVGIYPIGIEKLFSQVIYAQNPYKLIEGISLFFGDVSKYKEIPMKSFIMAPDIDKITSNCNEINEHIKNPKFKHLKDELSKIKITLESFPFFNPELKKNEDGTNPEGENSGMYEKNFYLGQKILFAMFFSSDLKSQGGEATTEDEKKIQPLYVTKKIGSEECISSVLEYYGYTVVVVTNYEEAIHELCKKNKENKCEYNSLWVVSGQEVPDLPTNNGDVNAPYYVEQFVDCGIKFWKNGGSLVLMGENDPHNFQVNLFLKKLVFPDGKKPNFKIGGNHPGRKILKADDSGKLERKQTFNSKIQEINNYERKSLANNLVQIFEGATVAYTKGDISPFIPFSRDSDGGINSLFYNGQDRGDGSGEGDIFIDCGYTKFFLDMKKCGTSRYLQNIGAFVGSAERRANAGYDPKLYRPDGISFTLNKSSSLYYKYPKKAFDVIYLVDATGSMSGSIENVKTYCVEIANILKNQMMLYDFRFGAVFYRDPIDSHSDTNDYYNLTSETVNLQNFVRGMSAKGGGDTPEDWVGGYNIALNNISWRSGNRLIIHIADAGAHGTDYTTGDKYTSEGPKLDNYIRECANRNITIVCFQIGSEPHRSFSRAKMLYNNMGNNNFKIQDFDQNKKVPGYFTDLVVNAITKVT